MFESDLTLYNDASWECPWCFHVMVALEEIGVKYAVVPVKVPLAAELKAEVASHAVLAGTPCLVTPELWLTESSAISEYLHERFAGRIYPSHVAERARARQLMSWLRTSLRSLREDRPATSVFKQPVSTPLGDKARADAAELVRVATAVVPDGKTQLFAEWSMADLDLAMMLMRLVANSDAVPPRLTEYALAQWGRHSVRKYLGYIPTSRLA